MTIRSSILTGGLVALAFAIAAPAATQAQSPMSLRGGASLESTNEAKAPAKQDRSQSALSRAYRQQPPLIPHKIDEYELDLKVNQCMGCHDWPRNVDVGAPKISETHYIDRNGVALDRVAETRWFCTQCHVTQANAKPLVKNVFQNATQVGN
jgi:cytochrome c-type protein NapB